MKLLAINIPTFERIESFKRVLSSIDNSISKLSPKFREQICVNIFDNNSSTQELKQQFIRKLGCSNLIKFSVNSSNIGGDENIYKCAIASKDSASYTWIIGDDDPLTTDSLGMLMPILNSYKFDLIICGSGDISYFRKYKSKFLFSSYPEYFKHLNAIKSEFDAIAHTLISCNIYKSSIFDAEYASYVKDKVTNRSNLIANFIHMYGILNGSFRCKKSPLLLINFPVLMKSTREKFEIDINSQIHIIYSQYLSWLCFNCGVRASSLKSFKVKSIIYNFWFIYKIKFKFTSIISFGINKLFGHKCHAFIKKIWNKF